MEQKLIEQFASIVGPKFAITDATDMASYMREWRDKWFGTSPLVLRPATTAEVSRVMRLAYDTNTKIVPQSGNTGLVGGGVAQGEVLLSLDRMTRIVDIDAMNFTMTVEGGCTLEQVKVAAEQAGRMFPLSLASEGSARIAGNLATNAGGVNMLAYGNARDLCLGLEVVLADGRVWNGLKGLRKDNTGYNLKNLFIGSEGTLGVITGAVLKLFSYPKRFSTALAAVPSPDAALALLNRLKDAAGRHLTACELIPGIGLSFTVKHMGTRSPFPSLPAWSVLIELSDAPQQLLGDVLEAALSRGDVADAVIAQSAQQRNELWALRENMSESQKFEGGSIKHDVSVPISRIPLFIRDATTAVQALVPGCRVVCFGHLGDGNMHFNVSQPEGADREGFLARWTEMSACVHDIVIGHGGSISAEHGIGLLKRDDMTKIKTPLELELMHGLKQLLDPKGILNPGKVLPGLPFRT
jgi:FAD/FMN-containing dehydrogenase